MDGGKVAARVRAGLRRGGALLTLSLAMVPVAFVATDQRAAAEDLPASTRFAVGSPAMSLAQDIAQRHWGAAACNGQVEITWGAEDESVNARSYWANPRSAYDDPQLNVQCRIVFNADLDFSWPKFCTVFVHEYGHLVGKPHSEDGPDVMSPIYRAPLVDCRITPDPTAAPEPRLDSSSEADSLVAAPLSRPHANKRSRARASRIRAKSKARARARAASVPALRHFVSSGHDHSH